MSGIEFLGDETSASLEEVTSALTHELMAELSISEGDPRRTTLENLAKRAIEKGIMFAINTPPVLNTEEGERDD